MEKMRMMFRQPIIASRESFVQLRWATHRLVIA